MTVRTRPPHTDAATIRCDSCWRVLNVHPGEDHDRVRAVTGRLGWSTKLGRMSTPGLRRILDVCPRCRAGIF